MNGGFGVDRYGFSSTERTANVAPSRPLHSARARASSTATAFALDDPAIVEVLAARDLLAVDRDEFRVERRAGGGEQIDVPVVGGDEHDPFAFAFDDQADRRALDTTGRQTAVDATPEDGRDLIAVQAVEESARLGRVDEAVVDAAWVVDRVVDGRLGDLVEHHPLDRYLRLEVLDEVPRDGLTLAVLIGREIQLGGVLESRTQLFHHGLAALGQLVRRLEAVVDVDVETLARQVGDVADGGAHVVAAAEELRDGLGLRG